MDNKNEISEFAELLRGLWDKELPDLFTMPSEQAIGNFLHNLESGETYSMYVFTKIESQNHICDLTGIRIRQNGPKGAEPTLYYSYKNNGSLRQMGIVNFLLYLSFVYNARKFVNTFFVRHYLNFKTYENSLSPIFVDNGFQVEYDFYGNPSENYKLTFLVGRYAFDYVKERTNDIESSYLYSLHIDIANFYSGIYTHHLERLGESYNTFKTNGDPSIKEFFAFLDIFNEKCNLSQTKGLIPGPFSSTVSAELVMCEIDKAISERILDGKKVGYARNVDDMTFFSDSKEALEDVLNRVQILLSNYQLPINDSKTKIAQCAFEFQEDMLKEIHSMANALTSDADCIDTIENFKASLAEAIRSDMFSVAKGVLTSVKTSFAKGEALPKGSTRLVNYFLKLALTEKWLGSRCMQIIAALLENASDEERQESLAKLMEKLPFIDDSCNDSVIQIWAYYLIGKYGEDIDHKRILNNYLARETPKNPIVLCALIKKGDGENREIFKAIKEEVTNGSLFYSRFAPTVLKLYTADKHNYYGYKNSLPKIVSDLFDDSNG